MLKVFALIAATVSVVTAGNFVAIAISESPNSNRTVDVTASGTVGSSDWECEQLGRRYCN